MIRLPLRFRAVWLAKLLLTAAILSAVSPVLASDHSSGHGSDDPDDSDNDTSDRPGRAASDKDDERQTGSGRGHSDDDDRSGSGRRPGHLQEANGSFDGRYVDFSLRMTGCGIDAFSVYGAMWFDSIELPGECEIDESSGGAHGSQLRLKGEDGELLIHDAPNGLLRFDVEDEASLSFRLASSVVVNETERGLELTQGNYSGRLFLTGDGNLSYAGGVATVTGEDGTFVMHPLRGDSAERVAIRDAIRNRTVGAEVDVLVEDGTVSSEVLTYDDVVLKVSKKNESAFRFLVDANLTEGRVFVVNFAPGAFVAGQIGLRYWDLDEVATAHEVAINESATLEELLDLQPGEGPQYFIVRDAGGVHVLVAVPHFSVHVFEVQSFAVQVVSAASVLVGVILGILFVAAGAGGLAVGRRR